MRRLLTLAALIVATLAVSGAAGPAHAGSGSCSDDGNGNISCTDQEWVCHGSVSLVSVTVTISALTGADGVLLGSGCSGYIGSISVSQASGDGIHVGAFAGGQSSPLEVGSASVTCSAHDPGKHQDGIQVLGGSYVNFHQVTVSCLSANDSQILIHEGAANQQEPSHVIFTNTTVDPQGTGAYVVSNGLSDSSGFVCLRLLSDGNLHDLWQGDGTTNPLWYLRDLPAGTRYNFDPAEFGYCTNA